MREFQNVSLYSERFPATSVLIAYKALSPTTCSIWQTLPAAVLLKLQVYANGKPSTSVKTANMNDLTKLRDKYILLIG